MNAIAAEAGITKPILYRHFGDKGGLYRALAKRHTDALLEACWTAIDSVRERRDRVEATLNAYLDAIESHPQVYRFLMHPAEDNSDNDKVDIGRQVSPLLRRLGEDLAVAISDRLELGEDADLVARIWGHGIVGMMHAAGDWWLAEKPCSREKLIKHLTDLLWARLTEVPDKKRPESGFFSPVAAKR